MLEELDVFDLVLRRINRQQVLKMDDLCDIADVVFAQIQNLQVHVRPKVGAQFLNLFFLKVKLCERV